MLDEEKRDEEGGTRRKEGRGRRRDEESEEMKKLLRKMKKSLKDASLALLGLVTYNRDVLSKKTTNAMFFLPILNTELLILASFTNTMPIFLILIMTGLWSQARVELTWESAT